MRKRTLGTLTTADVRNSKANWMSVSMIHESTENIIKTYFEKSEL